MLSAVSTFSSSPKATLAPLKMAIVAIESINLLFIVIRLPFIKILNPLCSRLRNLCEIANSTLNFVIASKTNAINLVILSVAKYPHHKSAYFRLSQRLIRTKALYHKPLR